MDKTKNVLGVIIARAGSKGLVGKHTRELLGQPVIWYTIDAARVATSLDNVIVTSDDEEVRRIAERCGIWAIGRPAELASDSATVDSAARFAVDHVEKQSGCSVTAVVILYGNIPNRPCGLINKAVELLIETKADSVQSYSPVGKYHPDWMVRLQDGDKVVLNCAKAIYRRQELEPLFIPNGGVIAVTRESLYRKPRHAEDFHCFLGEDRRGFVWPDSDLIVDIDERKDLFIAEAILRLLQEKIHDAK